MSTKAKSVEVYQVFASENEQAGHAAFLRRLSTWNTVTAVVLIFLFWLYQQLFGANIHNTLN